jgi:hypothetical protein
MKSIRLLVLTTAFLLGFVGGAGARRGAGTGPSLESLSLRALYQSCFSRWDRNHDGSLDAKEINALIENPQVRGNEAAAVVGIRRILPTPEAGKPAPALTLAQLLAATDDYGVQQDYLRLSKLIPTISRTLFFPADPGPLTIHQGPVGDCYLMSVMGAVAYRHPEAVRNMIHPHPDGSYEVRFPNRKIIQISPLTDSELVMCAPEGGDHGIWVAVLEKAYAEVRRETKETRSGVELDVDDAVTRDLISGGGRMGPVIAVFTGHDSVALRVGALAKRNPANAADQAQALLSELHQFPYRIMAAASANKPMPKGMPGKHAYGVLNYDPTRRVVRLFNPWGNDFTPSGPSGMVNGYATRQGVFDIPLQDFVQLFARLAHEIDPSAAQQGAKGGIH